MLSIMKGLALLALVLPVLGAAITDITNTAVVDHVVDIVNSDNEVSGEVEKPGAKFEIPVAEVKAPPSKMLTEAQDMIPGDLVSRAASYSLRCNGNNIPVKIIQQCANQIRRLLPPQIVWDQYTQAFWCARYYEEPTISVYGLSYDGKEHWSDGNRVADAVEKIIAACGTRGGSVQTADDPNFIVHVNNYE